MFDQEHLHATKSCIVLDCESRQLTHVCLYVCLFCVRNWLAVAVSQPALGTHLFAEKHSMGTFDACCDCACGSAGMPRRQACECDVCRCVVSAVTVSPATLMLRALSSRA